MQGTFPLPAAAGSYERVSAEPFGGVGAKKSFGDGGQDSEGGAFAPFTAVLAQAEAEKDAEAPLSEGSSAEGFLAEDSLPESALAEGSLAEGLFEFGLESALSASQGEEKQGTGFLPNRDAFLPDSSGFSKSLQGFLASLKAGLNKDGAEEGAGESVFGSLKPGLAGSLKKRRAAAGAENAEGGEVLSGIGKAQPEELSQGEEVLSSSASAEAGSGLSSQEEEAAAELLAASRFHSYLKDDAARVSAVSVSPKASKAEKTAKSGERSQGDSAELSEVAEQGLSGQGIAIPAVSEEREGLNSGMSKTPEDVLKEGVSRNRGFESAVSARNASGDDAASEGEASDISGEGQDGTAQRRAAAENRVNFDQFFESITARRGFTAESGARPGALELGNSGTPLARDEALREGLTNVVRFVRANGEQKASLIVDPPALGRVSVELTSSATGLEASIKVSSEQIRQLVQDQLAQLRWSLSQQGVQLTHFSVDVQQEDGGRRQQEPGRERRRARGISGIEGASDEQDEQAGFRVDLDQGLLYWLA
jgi:flagellar hook-length control protein FliK